MTNLVLAAAIFSLLATIGHFAMGKKMFLQPIMESNADILPKKVMESVFHYMSFFLVFTTFVLFAFSEEYFLCFKESRDVLMILGIIYSGFAVVQIIIGLTAPIKNGIFKLFQWILWVLIALFCFLAA